MEKHYQNRRRKHTTTCAEMAEALLAPSLAPLLERLSAEKPGEKTPFPAMVQYKKHWSSIATNSLQRGR
jgi:hypothetical protein